jgi:hypothetical protein
MKRWLFLALTALVVLGLAAGCARKAEQAQSTTSDSLFASNPSEPAPGSLTPEQQYQQQPPAQQPQPAPKPASKPPSKPAAKPEPVARGVTLPAGTAVKLTVDAELTSETAQVGEEWTGTVKEPVIIGTEAPIPAGSKVHGVVTAVQPAGGKAVRAYLVLHARSVEVLGKSHAIDASADTLFAASATARNVGAIAGGTAAGAVLGKVIGGSNKGAVIGGVIGGAAATGAVLKSKGYQSVVKAGTEITFSTTSQVVLRQ